jgi:acetyl-CoA carboxylase biotin carboxyl carrier protein
VTEVLSRPEDARGEVLGELSRVIADVARIAPYPPTRISVTLGEARLEVDWGSIGTSAPGADVALVDPEPEEEGLFQVCAPLVGTFFRCPQPGAAPFVEAGDHVEAGQQVAIVEAMKLMNSVEAGISGCVRQVLAADGEAVQYDQPLLVITPD